MGARLLFPLSMLATVFLVSCGGSSSETPWPREPREAVLGPAGESGESGEEPPPSEVTNEGEAPPSGAGGGNAGSPRVEP